MTEGLQKQLLENFIKNSRSFTVTGLMMFPLTFGISVNYCLFLALLTICSGYLGVLSVSLLVLFQNTISL